MNKYQRSLLWNTIWVVLITTIFVVVMINLKNYINKSEAMRTMQQLGQIVLQYRQDSGYLPPEYQINNMKAKLPGSVRLGAMNYRALWISFDAGPETILIYVKKNYRSIMLGPGYIVLKLDGSVEWMGKHHFELVLQSQQSEAETELLEKQIEEKTF